MTHKQKRINRIQLFTVGFYAVTGILLLASLPFTSFPPHLGLLGIVSLITAYSVYTKRAWAPWLVFILVVGNTVFAGVTLFSVGFTNLLVTALLIPYLVFTWIVTVEYLLLKRD
jgi:hypothetical protein